MSRKKLGFNNHIDIKARWPVSQKSLSPETDLSSLITLATIVFSLLKLTSGVKTFGLLSDLRSVLVCFKKPDPGY